MFYLGAFSILIFYLELKRIRSTKNKKESYIFAVCMVVVAPLLTLQIGEVIDFRIVDAYIWAMHPISSPFMHLFNQ
ncbi:hypothetical protein [Paraliobacillus salinarum]|uniref:hypothetical protein n=1 Tax=Paraliobacillus salinarum TaxID=1158996 RepID=UPI0015F5F6F7|nr:hypothetical protein [Paraliobacillus salinarum]